jgi:hypothetical protein
MGLSEADAESVVTAFIRAMHEWELDAWRTERGARQGRDPEPWTEIRAGQERVFAAYCTTRDRPYGRQASFQHPPEYDPAGEDVSGVEVRGRTAQVETERRAPLGGGRRRYQLQARADRWLIDSVKGLADGSGRWENRIL